MATLIALAAAVGGRRPRFPGLVLLPEAMRMPGGQVCGPAWVAMVRLMERLRGVTGRQRNLRLCEEGVTVWPACCRLEEVRRHIKMQCMEWAGASGCYLEAPNVAVHRVCRHVRLAASSSSSSSV